MFQVYGTNATKCDPEMWQGAFNYLIYAYSAIVLVAVFTFCTTFCLGAVWAAMGVSAAMEIEEERAKRPPPLSEPLAPAPVVVPQPLACCVHSENAWELGGEQDRVRKLSGRRFQLRTKITKLRKRRGRKKPRNVARERALAPLTAQRGRQGPLRVEG